MKRALIILLVLVVLGAAAYVLLNRTDPADGVAPPLAGAPAQSDPVARGAYLAKMADCTACHTVPGSNKPFAGGVAFTLPFGTIYSTNITADETTGIGRWTDDQFVRAVREGVGAHGERLYPAFPYTSFTQLSRADVLAIKAYLFSLPRIEQHARPNDLSFPFNQRWAMGFWNALFFKSARFTADASKSTEWNSGAYLATALGHCAECHTPRNIGYGLRQSQALAGETLQGWHAYNITSDPTYGIGGWTDQELADYLSKGHAQGHGSAAGPMGEAVENSLQYLDPKDLNALVAYLRSVPAHEGKDGVAINAHPAPVLASNSAAPGGDPTGNPLGAKLFEGACASCHQWNGQGQQSPYAALLGSSSVNDPAGGNMTQILLHGAKLRIDGNDVFMPAFSQGYSDTEIAALANYVTAHFGGKTGTVTPAQVAKRRAAQ